MKKGSFLITVLLISMLFIQQRATAQYTIPAKMNWWYEDRFGMLIHFGSYSYYANGEWEFSNDNWTKSGYQTTISSKFNPVNFNGGTIARLAKNAGMKYLVITAKHHEGFCMWQTAVQSFKDATGTKLYDLPDFTVFKTRDILQELKDSCDAQGIKFCLYYSILDWNHPSQQISKGTLVYSTMASFDARTNYINDMKAQLNELITKYHPAVLWFDGDWMLNGGTPTLASWWTKNDGIDLYNYLIGLDPNLVINERVCRSFGLGDFMCPEQTVPATPESRPWETCQTMNNSWGYNINDNDYKSSKDLIQQLVQVVSRDGNYLLNIGPKGDGTVTTQSVSILKDFAAWMSNNSESIYGTTRSPYPTEPAWGYYTKKTGKLYAHVFNWPTNSILEIPSLSNTINKIYLLNDSTKSLNFTDSLGIIKITVPSIAPNSTNSVVVVSVSGLPGVPVGYKALGIQEQLAESVLSTAVIGIIPGTYSQSAHDVLVTALNNAYAISESNTPAEINQMVTSLTTALTTFNNSINCSTNTLTNGDYNILEAGTNLYWTNTGLNKTNLSYTEEKPVFQQEISGSNDQLFHLTMLSNKRYEIDSKSDVPAYINESAKIRRDISSFLPDWNTVNILYNGSAYAVQTAGSGAGSGYWTLVSDVVTGSGITTLNPETNFILNFVKKVTSAIPETNESSVKFIPMKDGIQIIQDQQSEIIVYNLNGSLVKTLSASGNVTIPLSTGFYIVKIKNQDSIFNEKIIVK